MDKCPICGMEMKRYTDVLDGYVLMEGAESCPNGHYHYEYITGVTNITVGGITLWYNYLTPFPEVERVHRMIDRLVERYKKRNSNGR